MNKKYFFAKFYDRNEEKFFFLQNFRSFSFIANKIKIAEVIKYHQKKALFVGKKGRQFCLGATSHDRGLLSQVSIT